MKNKKIIIVIVILLLIAVITTAIIISNNKKVDLNKETIYNYFVFLNNDSVGVIDKDGNVIVKPEYAEIIIPNPELPLFICQNNYDDVIGSYETHVFNESGEKILTDFPFIEAIEITEGKYNKHVLKYQDGKKWGLVNYLGEKITKPIYDSIKNIGLYKNEILVRDVDKWGVIDINGKSIIKLQYDSIESDEYRYNISKSGYIITQKTSSGVRYGYLNEKGKMILESEYNEIVRLTDIEDDSAFLIVSKNGQKGVMKNNKEVIPSMYQTIDYLNTGKVFRIKRNVYFGLLDFNGKSILDPIYDELELNGEYIVTIIDGEKTVRDKNGKEIKDAKYISKLKTDSEKYYMVVDQNYQSGIIDKDGKEVIEPKYLVVDWLFDNYFMVCDQNGKVGVLDENQKVILPFKYDEIQLIEGTNLLQTYITNNVQIYKNGKDLVCEGENLFTYKKENYILAYSEHKDQYFDFAGNIKLFKDVTTNKLFSKKENGKWGFVDANGKVVIDYKYTRVTEFNEYGYAGIKENGKWGVINSTGEIIKKPEYIINTSNKEPYFLKEYYKIEDNFNQVYYTNISDLSKISENFEN